MFFNNLFSRIPSLFSLIKKSLSGEVQDYTNGSIRKAVLLLAIPMILEMLMESVFAVTDLFFVGHLSDSSYAITTVGLTESVLSIIYSLAIGISMAATAMVARRIGEKNKEGAAESALQSLILATSIGIIICVIGFILAPDILRWMGAEPRTVEMGTPYTRIMMGGSLVIMFLFLINGIFRGAGDAFMAMKSLWLANICNIILCPVLIYGFGPIPAFGLTGAAIATTTGRGIGVLYQLYHLFGCRSIVNIKPGNIKINWTIIRSLIKIASPGTLQFIIGSCSWIFLARLVAETGHSSASAGYQTAIRLVIFFLLPAWGMSNATATLVGQNLGAGKPERAVDCIIKTAKYNTIFMAMVSMLLLFTSNQMIALFTNDASVKAYAVQALQTISFGYLFYGIGMVLINAFNGAGDTKTPTWINLFCFWGFQIPFAYLLAKQFTMGPTGVFIAIPVTETLVTVVAYILFKKGKWKKTIV